MQEQSPAQQPAAGAATVSTTAAPAPTAPSLALPANPDCGTQVPSKSSAWSLFGDLLICAVVAVCSALLAVKYSHLIFDEPKQASPSFVVVDMEELAREQVLAMGDMVRSGSMAAEEMPARTRAFSQALLDQLAAYAKQNILVLNSSAVAALPDGVSDETSIVRGELQKAGAMQARKTGEK